MTTSQWLVWMLLLLMQNASFTLVSRARNSKSIAYHSVAAVFSNGIWFASQFFVIKAVTSLHGATLVLAGLMYLVITTSSSVAMHWFLMRKVEGKIHA